MGPIINKRLLVPLMFVVVSFQAVAQQPVTSVVKPALQKVYPLQQFKSPLDGDLKSKALLPIGAKPIVHRRGINDSQLPAVAPRVSRATIARRAPLSSVQMIGSVVNAASWDDIDPTYGDEIPYGMYSFKTGEKMAPTMLSDVDNYLAFNGGVSYFDNKAHGIVYENSAWFGLSVYYLEYDMNSWETTTSNSLPGIDYVSSPGLVYDHVSGNTYGIFYNADASGNIIGRTLATIDFTTLTRSDIGPIDSIFRTLSVSPQGELYGITSNGNLMKIDKRSANLTLVGNTGVKPAAYLQSATFDQQTGTFYWAAYVQTGQSLQSRLYQVDPATAEVSLIGTFADNEELVGLYVPVPEAADRAPAKVTTLNASFQPEATTGTIIFQIPRRTFGGASFPSGTELNYTIRANGNVVGEGKGVIGRLVSKEVTVEPGMTTFTVTVSNNAGNSPEAKLTMYIGPDEPVGPNEVKLSYNDTISQASLTWNAPTKGRHNGTLKVENLNYTIVRYPNDTVATNYTGTNFSETLSKDRELTPYYYIITANNGKIKGNSARSNNIVIGRALEVPYEEHFDSARQFMFYTIIDANSDTRTWQYLDGNARYGYSAQNAADDWLLTPALHMKAGRTYNLSFHTGCGLTSYPERIAVGFGTGTNTQSYETVFPAKQITSRDTIITTKVTPQSDGDYHFGFHALSDANMFALLVDNIYVGIEPTAASADSVTNLKVVAAGRGKLNAEISFNAPTKTVDGTMLTTLEKITVTNAGRTVGSVASPTPGNAYSITDNKPVNGTNEYTVIAYNSEGPGRERKASTFVGIDEPNPPTDARLADMKDSIKLTWTPPTKGASGHFVDPDSLTYNLYTYSGYSLYNYKSGLTGSEYILPGINPAEGSQRVLAYYIDANSAGGSSTPVPTTGLLIGKPSVIPYHEPVAASGLISDYIWTEHTNSTGWTLASGLSINFDNGCFYYQPTDTAGTSSLCTEKIDLGNAEHPCFSFAYLTVGGTDMGFDVVVDKAPQDVNEKVSTVNFKTMTGIGWQRAFIDLSAYKGEPYVMVKIRGWNRTTGQQQYPLVIDDIRLTDRKTHDLSAIISSPASTTAGQAVTVTARIANEGSASARGYTVRLLANGHEVASFKETRGELPVGGIQDYDLKFTPDMSKDKVMLTAFADYADDENNTDNRADSVLIVRPVQAPVVDDLKGAVRPDSSVLLEWTVPEIDTSPKSITESFENYDAFIHADFGPWLDRNLDDGQATYGFNSQAGISFPDMSKPLSYVMFNPEKAGADMTNQDIANIIGAHTGNQYLTAFSTVKRNGNSWEDIENNDWLISPELADVQNKYVTFFVRAYSSNDVPESYEVLYSTTNTDTASFTSIGGIRSAQYGSWQKDSVALPADAKYFAIRACSKGKYIFMLDDITFTPAINYGNSIDGYKIYRNDSLIATIPATSTAYTDYPNKTGATDYFVTVVYPTGESGRSNIVTLQTIATGINTITTGDQKLTPVYSISGIRVAESLEKAKHLTPGVYISGGRKVIVK